MKQEPSSLDIDTSQFKKKFKNTNRVDCELVLLRWKSFKPAKYFRWSLNRIDLGTTCNSSDVKVQLNNGNGIPDQTALEKWN